MSKIHFCVYSLSCAGRGVFYVGKTSSKDRNYKHRYNEHLSLARQGKKDYKYNIIRLLLKENKTPIFNILYETDDEEDSFEKEKIFIKSLAPEANMTDGGEGICGFKFLPEQIERSRSKRIGRIVSEETKRRLAEALKGKPHTKARCENISKAKKAQNWHPTEEVRHKMSLRQQGRIYTPDLTVKWSGEKSGMSKFTDEIIKEIRRLRREENLTYKQLSVKFNISISNVGKIVNRQLW